MTKRREPLTFERALCTIGGAIGWDVCAAIVGRSERAVRAWSEPDIETEISILDAQRLDSAFMARGGDHAPFHRVYAARLGIEAAQPDETALIEMAASVAKESGEATAAFIAAARNPSAANRRAARKEGEEALAAITSGLARLDRPGEES
ncbi:hypothetical protein MZO42_06065 [Sphingomonas psychrotolerans]|uniref:Uncharacterized protein n=1 Tax=Sphingomonas psychrotolerans TaxID=1327635 RepID=A0ABU3N192_9SPHN|nr:hypothetical protein [Sphingomonas psychrotolerans]MDT8758257.1 hypothetical protein [Sphingomonas psychrotolerans]